MTEHRVARCDNCQAVFDVPKDTALDLLVTCPLCLHVAECEEFFVSWNESHRREDEGDGG